MATYRMANVWRDPRTGICYLRRGIPAPLRPHLGGLWELKVSLRTKDPKVAKQRYPIVAAEADRRLEEARRTREASKQDDDNGEPRDLPGAWLQWNYAQHHNGAVGDPLRPPVGLLDPEPPLPLRISVTDTEATAQAPLKDLIAWWAAERNPPRKTLMEWTRVVARLQAEFPHATPEGMTRRDLVRFKDALLDKGLAPKSVKNHLNVVHALWGGWRSPMSG